MLFFHYFFHDSRPHGSQKQAGRDVESQSGIHISASTDGNKYLAGDGMAHEESRTDNAHPVKKGVQLCAKRILTDSGNNFGKANTTATNE